MADLDSGEELLFACPVCQGPLEATSPRERRCLAEGASFRQEEGIWRFLPPGRLDHFQRFMKEYETVRQAEGRGIEEVAYYRALPFRDLSGRHVDNWRIRATSFREFVARVLEPLAKATGRPLAALDLGAGNGWLSYHLARRGHRVAAVDLQTGRLDGLGAFVHYDAPFTPVQAEFEHLPFAAGQVDLVVYNASFHYATDYVRALAEARRVLAPGGRIAILDSPVYTDGRSGEQMVRERETQFLKDYGFPSNAIPCENYLTHGRLAALADEVGLRWEIVKPFYGWAWALRPWRARLRGRREPASFMVIVGTRALDR